MFNLGPIPISFMLKNKRFKPCMSGKVIQIEEKALSPVRHLWF
jgi:hypothetical protein